GRRLSRVGATALDPTRAAPYGWPRLAMCSVAALNSWLIVRSPGRVPVVAGAEHGTRAFVPRPPSSRGFVRSRRTTIPPLRPDTARHADQAASGRGPTPSARTSPPTGSADQAAPVPIDVAPTNGATSS